MHFHYLFRYLCLFSISIFSCISTSWALEFLKEEEEFTGCSSQIEQIIRSEFQVSAKILSSRLWQRIPVITSAEEPSFSYFLPEGLSTPEIEVAIQDSKIILQSEKSGLIKGWKLDPKSCQVKEVFQGSLPFQEGEEDSLFMTERSAQSEDRRFTSADLKDLMHQSEYGAIYVWSPHMILSVMGIQVISEVCQSLQVPLTVLMDPNATDFGTVDTQISFSVSNEHKKRAEANALQFIGSGLHFPNLILYRNGELLPEVLHGVKSSVAYEQFLKVKLKLNQSK